MSGANFWAILAAILARNTPHPIYAMPPMYRSLALESRSPGDRAHKRWKRLRRTRG